MSRGSTFLVHVRDQNNSEFIADSNSVQFNNIKEALVPEALGEALNRLM